VEYHLSKG